MPDEAAANGNDLIALIRLLCEFLDGQHEADQKLQTDPAAAMRDSVQLALALIMEIAEYQPAPRPPIPGVALRRLLSAFDDLENGISSELQPKSGDRRKGNYLRLETRFARVKPAVAMELLIKAGWRWEEAAKEVVRKLGSNHPVFASRSGAPWRIVARWRTEILSGDDPGPKQLFDDLLTDLMKLLHDREETADGLIKVARILLSELDRSA